MIYVIQAIKQLWASIVGVFYLGQRLRNKELRQREQDTHYYFKQQSKKELARFQVKERLFLKKAWKLLSKRFPKKYRGKDIYVYHNYFAGVLAPARLNDTPEKMLLRYWEEGVGPYFKMYKATLEQISELLDEKGRMEPRVLIDRVAKVNQLMVSLPDLDKRAENVLNVQKKVNLELRKKQQQLNEDRKKVLDQRDKEMLEIEEAVLSNTASKATENLKQLRKAKKGAGIVGKKA